VNILVFGESPFKEFYLDILIVISDIPVLISVAIFSVMCKAALWWVLAQQGQEKNFFRKRFYQSQIKIQESHRFSSRGVYCVVYASCFIVCMQCTLVQANKKKISPVENCSQ
jgi:hypothetical protein